MVSRPRGSNRLKKLAKEIPDDATAHKLLSGLENPDIALADHAAAMMGASLVEKALEVTILSRFIPMSGENRKRIFDYEYRGALVDLSAKIRIGRALGLFGPLTEKDLTHIREIRNAFAHSLWFITFETDEVADMCDFHVTKVLAVIADKRENTPRARYIRTAIFIAKALKDRIQYKGSQLEALSLARFPTPDHRLS